MKLNNLFPNLTRNLISGMAMMTIVAGTSILTSCTKENNVAPESNGTPGIEFPNRPEGFFDSKPSAKTAATDHGYFYSLYYTGGSASISFPNAGTTPGNFAITYNNVDDVVGGKGWNPGSSTRTINYNVGSLQGSYNMVGVYGWTTSPLIEYYVVEKGFIDWDFGPTADARAFINNVTVDGHSYKFCRHRQDNKPSIQGTQTFWQYIDNWGGGSLYTNKAVSMTGHVNNWKTYGGKGFGTHDYQVFALEAYGNKTGYINATVW